MAMREKWIENIKRADFRQWAEELKVPSLIARLIRNRNIESVEEARMFLYGTMEDLEDPRHMKDMDKAVDLIERAVRNGEKIAISSDYDDDGIFSGRILLEGFRNVGAEAYVYSPNRMTEGYGINRRIIDSAKEIGCSLIVTCDNGIAAFKEIEYAKNEGFTVVVTDHHEIPFEETETGLRHLLPPADAIVDPKRADSEYAFRELCGAGVAFRLIQVLYSRFGIDKKKEAELYEYVGLATVADVVPLLGENRILVKAGIQALRKTTKVPFLKLFEACSLERASINSYHLGFVLGPCFNAVGRLGDISLAFRFLDTADEEEATRMAERIRGLNEERKQMTEEGFKKALEIVEARETVDPVLLVYLQDVHESVIGIIAGRLKEKYARPALVFTDAEGGLIKGSGRSIPAYNMVVSLTKAKAYLEKFGGHKMAAGMSLKKENFEALRAFLNETQTLTEDDLTPKVEIDAQIPLMYVTEELVNDLEIMEPFGQGNPKPLFAGKHFGIRRIMVIGKTRTHAKLIITDDSGATIEAMLYGRADEFFDYVRQVHGEGRLSALLSGYTQPVDMAFTFQPGINDFRGMRNVQIVIQNYCKIS